MSSTLQTHLSLRTQRCRFCNYLPFPEETEAQSSQGTCPWSQCQSVTEQDSEPIHRITELYHLAAKITAVNILVNILLDQSLCVYKHILSQYKEIKPYMLFCNPLFKFNNMPWAAFHVSNYIPNFSFLMAAHHNYRNLIPTGHLV